MTNLRTFRSRILADVVAGSSVLVLVAIAGRNNANRGWAIPILGILPLAAGLAAYLEPSVKRVWIHGLVIVSPALVLAFGGAVTCRGFECAGLVGLVAAALIFALVLVGLSFVVFYVKRRLFSK